MATLHLIVRKMPPNEGGAWLRSPLSPTRNGSAEGQGAREPKNGVQIPRHSAVFAIQGVQQKLLWCYVAVHRGQHTTLGRTNKRLARELPLSLQIRAKRPYQLRTGPYLRCQYREKGILTNLSGLGPDVTRTAEAWRYVLRG